MELERWEEGGSGSSERGIVDCKGVAEMWCSDIAVTRGGGPVAVGKTAINGFVGQQDSRPLLYFPLDSGLDALSDFHSPTPKLQLLKYSQGERVFVAS